MRVIERSFLARPTPEVARDLLGHRIVAWDGDERLVARVVETEAYLGPEDPGSHATRGRDTQAHRLWDRPGLAYVYICYGIHQMLNVAAHAEGAVGAVLFRAAEPREGLDQMRARTGREHPHALMDGPGKLAQALGVTRQAHEGVDLTEPGGLHLARGDPVPDARIAVTGRIGLSKGGEHLLRFVDRDSPALSRPVADAPSAGSG